MSRKPSSSSTVIVLVEIACFGILILGVFTVFSPFFVYGGLVGWCIGSEPIAGGGAVGEGPLLNRATSLVLTVVNLFCGFILAALGGVIGTTVGITAGLLSAFPGRSVNEPTHGQTKMADESETNASSEQDPPTSH